MTIYTPRELARERVRKGVEWLDKHAAPGWQRHLVTALSPDNVSWRAYNSRADECVLALAFEDRGDLAGDDGRIHFANVTQHFGLTLIAARTLGFCATPDDPVTEQMLDEAWQAAIFDYARPSFAARIHPVRSTE